MKTKDIWFLVVAFLAIAADQATKIWVYTQLQFQIDEIQVIPGFFSIVHAQNPGAALGFLRDFAWRNWVFIGFTAIAVGIIVNMQRQLADKLRFLPTVLGLIIGGAVGNGIDRVHKQTVTDFLRFYTENPRLVATLNDWGLPSEYPSFNIADAALVVGVGLFVIHYWFLDEGELDGAKAAEPAEPTAEAGQGQ